jgi:hypothetical protein
MRSVSSARISAYRKFVLLAPPGGEAPEYFPTVIVDRERSGELLMEMQRFRGAIYLKEGAIGPSQISEDGRHALPDDEESWHLLVRGEDDSVQGCMRYRTHRYSVPISKLGVSSSAIAQCDRWGPAVRTGIRSEIAKARYEGIGFGEAGGWALAEQLRCSTEALRMVLATYSLAQVLGDAIVLSTATMRNGSASILFRIGGQALSTDLGPLPPYYDPHYGCEMQLIRFDSRLPNPKYHIWVNQLRSDLLTSPLLCTRAAPRRPADNPTYESLEGPREKLQSKTYNGASF